MKISKIKQEKISEQILAYLFNQSPKAIFTSYIAAEMARDEEFIKRLLLELKSKNLLQEIKKNASGDIYIKRSRWKLTDQAYSYYKKVQNSSSNTQAIVNSELDFQSK
jgi:hypothetical protein